MIELLSAERCVDCDLCVQVCPMQVFDRVPDGHPVLARPERCQTCFICEAYCPTDALWVSPNAEAFDQPDEAALAAEGQLGSYRRAIGWHKDSRERRYGSGAYVVLDKYFSNTL